jgi:hypothetical protein
MLIDDDVFIGMPQNNWYTNYTYNVKSITKSPQPKLEAFWVGFCAERVRLDGQS